MTNKASDPTFRAYSIAQAQAYAAGRSTAYTPLLYSTVLEFHTERDGCYDLLLDVGCGPGNATRDLAASFVNVIGVDPSPAMIQVARAHGYLTKSGNKVLFEVTTADEITSIPGIQEGSVDMITAAMAAHWFDMPQFWTAAAKVLKLGGTVALWTCGSVFCHPSTPNAGEIQRILFRLEREHLAPFELPPNRVSRDMYDELMLPWQCPTPNESFSKEAFKRHVWDRDGALSNGESFFSNTDKISLERLKQSLETGSRVTRWRQANPDLAGTEKDCVKQTIRELKEVLGGSESLVLGMGTVVMLFQKTS
ncbi:MAG: hypothetical protein M1818_003159 [Claussenomyces sp. TS43310]|nr:MAG: hypothetical protein M1818_003159 [Claussenomyces sp. TS43310]